MVKNLIRLVLATIVALLIIVLMANGQSTVDFKLYDNVYTYGKECGLNANNIRNIKKYTSPAPYIKMVGDCESISTIDRVYLYFEDSSKVILIHCPSYQNKYEYLLPVSHRKEYVKKLKKEPVVRVELVERVLDVNVLYDNVIFTRTLEDSETFIKYFKKND